MVALGTQRNHAVFDDSDEKLLQYSKGKESISSRVDAATSVQVSGRMKGRRKFAACIQRQAQATGNNL